MIVFVGGGIGAALRHGFNLVFARLFGTAIPHATRSGIPHHWQLSLTTGILGGYATFSIFSLDVAVLYERGEIGLAALYALLPVVLSIGGLFGGLAVVRVSPSPSARGRACPSIAGRGRAPDWGW